MIKRVLPKILGWCVIGVGVACAVAVMANARTRALGGRDISPLLLYTWIGLVTGIGLVLLRKWAALVLSILSLASGIALITGSIVAVPFPWVVLNIGFATTLFIPTLVTMYCWHELKWRGRFGL